MIKETTVFMVGRVQFSTLEEAKQYESDLSWVDVFDSFLNSKENLDSNGKNYVQHSAKQVRSALTCYQDLVKQWMPSLTERVMEDPLGMIGRYLDDSSDKRARLLYGMYIRLNSIDQWSREWGQIYYKNKPNPDAVEVK